jgi:hypothetical protein
MNIMTKNTAGKLEYLQVGYTDERAIIEGYSILLCVPVEVGGVVPGTCWFMLAVMSASFSINITLTL